MKIQEYLDYAVANGAKHAVHITIDKIVFDHRAYLKCMFGCEGSNPDTLCPSQPGRIKPWEYEPILMKYSWGILIHANDKRITQKVALNMEKTAFADGYYFAFSLSDCSLCDPCNRSCGDPCAYTSEVRPSMHSTGIDVFKTARDLGLPIHTLKDPDSEEQNWFSLVLFE